MTITQVGKRFVAHSTYAEKDIVKAAGFRWDRDNRVWYTTDASVAAKLSDPDAAAKIMAAQAEKEAVKAVSIEQSRASAADIDLPVPDGLAYLPYQRAGIAYALAHTNVLFGDEMGLGKTIQAIGVINADPTIKRVLVICPASLRLNWLRELNKWLTREMTKVIATGQSCHPGYADITIINYDIVSKHAETLRSQQWDMIIADEAHYMKSPDAKRTQAVVGYEKKGKVIQTPIEARRAMFLTGTPIPNRPIEGWPLFHYLAPDEFRSFFGYAKRYAAAHQNGYGWDFSGSANLPELQDKLRSTIMVRRLKADVLTELPAKRRSIIEIPANGASHAVEAESRAWEAQEATMLAMRTRVELAKASADPNDYADAVAALKAAATAAFAELAKLRHATAVAKIPYVVEHVKDLIEDGKKVVVFGHHHDVIEALAKEFGSACMTIYGPTSMADRQAAVDRFQSDPTCLVAIGSFGPMGTGLTLTAASTVVFAELDWVPGTITQAEDRCHRIGQKDMVLAQHLVLEGSLDARMASILVAKQEVIAAALDDVTEQAAPVIPSQERERAATESLTRAKIEEAAAKLTAAQIEAIHEALRVIAGYCDGARELDGAGFSKVDVQIGHSLAACCALSPRQAVLGAKLVKKYRRQVPDGLLAAVAMA
jgi:superfamily II DNA or RNA helicase